MCIKTSDILLKCRFLGFTCSLLNQYSRVWDTGVCSLMNSSGDLDAECLLAISNKLCPKSWVSLGPLSVPSASELQNLEVEVRVYYFFKTLRRYGATAYSISFCGSFYCFSNRRKKTRHYSFCCCLIAQSYPTLCDPRDCCLLSSACPWNSPDKNTGVGCHFLLQWIFQIQDWTRVSSISSELPGKLNYSF